VRVAVRIVAGIEDPEAIEKIVDQPEEEVASELQTLLPAARGTGERHWLFVAPRNP
jgi:hypothetical protein